MSIILDNHEISIDRNFWVEVASTEGKGVLREQSVEAILLFHILKLLSESKGGE